MTESELLDIDAAAAQLGLSSLRVRQLIRENRLVAVRDNHGRWRVPMPQAPIAAAQYAQAPDEAAGVEILMEEALELRARLLERERAIESMTALLDRQQNALDQAVDRIETLQPMAAADIAGQRDRAIGLAERAVVRAEQSESRFRKLRDYLESAMRRLEALSGRDVRLRSDEKN